MVEDGERVFLVHVGRAPVGDTILADLEMDEVGPIAADRLAPRRFSGFEFSAGDVMHRAYARANEAGVRKIMVVDPYGQLRFAAPSRYDRQ